MSKYLGLTVLLLVGLLFTGCSGTSLAPKEMAMEFLKAVEDGEYEKASKFGTETTQEQMGIMEGAHIPAQGRTPIVTKVDEDGDSAMAHYHFEGEEEKERVLKMVNSQSDGWQVETTKADLAGSEDEE